MARTVDWATDDPKTPLTPRVVELRPVSLEDVLTDIAYCGVCHAGVHLARDELGGALAAQWPCMPGHEIAETVAQVDEHGNAHTHAVGDRVGVGWLVDWERWGGDAPSHLIAAATALGAAAATCVDAAAAHQVSAAGVAAPPWPPDQRRCRRPASSGPG